MCAVMMSAELIIKDVSVVAVRGPGDGMETDKPLPAPEQLTEAPLQKICSPKHSPRVATGSPGVLHLGKVSRDACLELEAVRIVVPRAAIIRTGRSGAHTDDRGSPQHGDEPPPAPPSPPPPAEPLQEYKNSLEKLQSSERRLLQDKEGLSNQLRVQTEVRYTCYVPIMHTYTTIFNSC